MIGEYRLMQKLGGGGFSTVHLAEHIREHSQVAIKILRVSLIKKEDFRDFLNETRTMIRLCHPHIMPLLDVGLSREDFPFLVMEYASEGTLRDRHSKGAQVPLATIVEYVEQIASALQYAHDRRIIHRDVKPENMLLRVDGTLLLSDFGIAKIMEQTTLVSMQTRIGTPVYMAPEQHTGYPCFASDQYALAVVVYEWISGTRPFQGTREWLAVQHVTAPPPSLLNQRPMLPSSVEQVVFKALSKTPEQRFATVQEFATALRVAVQQATVSVVHAKEPPLDEPLSNDPFIHQLTGTMSLDAASKIDIPPIPQPLLAHQSVEPEGMQTRQAFVLVDNTLPSNQPWTLDPTAPAPQQFHAPSPVAVVEKPSGTVKTSRRLFPLRIKLFMGGGLLVGILILVLIVRMMGVNPLPNSHTSPTPTISALGPNTVSRLVKKWNFETEDVVTSSPSVVGGVVYVGSRDHKVYAVDAQLGQKKWAFQTGGCVCSSPKVVDGVVYVGSDDHNVYAIDARSGQQQWAFQTGNYVVSSPTVVDGVVYIGSDDHNVYAIDARSGQQTWAFQTGNYVFSSPTVINGVVYVGSEDNNVYAIDARSGQKKWAFQTGSYVDSSPTVVNGVVYVGSEDNNVYAIDARSGQKKWAFQTGSYVNSSPTVVNGVVYVGSDDHSVYAIDARSGQKKWAFQTGDMVYSSPEVVDGVVYVGSLDDNVYAIDTQSGQKKWAFQTGDGVYSSPAVVDGKVYVGSLDRNIYAFALPAATS
jgi:outer membrane protein assembly factor BamB/serine/threonine protein kinase